MSGMHDSIGTSMRSRISALRADPRLIYLDSAATALVPDVCTEALEHYYTHIHAPVLRSTCPRAEQATSQVEQARRVIARAMGTDTPNEIVFTAGATMGIHLAIQSLAQSVVQSGDHIMLNPLEHHSNLLPWIRFAQEGDLVIDWAPTTGDGYVDYERALALISNKTTIIAWALASHAIGMYEDEFWHQLVTRAHAVGALIIGDASQFMGHRAITGPYAQVDVLVASAHKMMGPTGVGAVRILRKHHERIRPWIRGGGMVREVDLQGESSWLAMPQVLEAGTLPTAQIYSWAQVITWLDTQYTLDELRCYEAGLIKYLVDGLRNIPGMSVVLPEHTGQQAPNYSHLVSFYHRTIHAHDIAHALGQDTICVRAGTLCAQPAMEKLGLPAVVRASVQAYTTREDIDALLRALAQICV